MNSSDKKTTRLVELTICTGTACYVMGGSELLLIEESLPDHLKNKVVVSGCPCLGHCRDGAHHSAGAVSSATGGTSVNPPAGGLVPPRHVTPCVLINHKLHGPVDSGDIVGLLEEAVHALEQ